MRLVVKIGGSVCISEGGPDAEYFKKALPVLKEVKEAHQLIIGIGGGLLIRAYNKNVEDFDLTNDQKEWIFVKLLHANAQFLASLLGTQPLFSLDSVEEDTEGVISGIMPGRSTDANAALAAAKIRADLFIKMTDVDGIYTADPDKDKDAKKLESVSYEELRKYTQDLGPAAYGVLDSLAIETLEKHRIRTVIIDGTKPENLLRAIRGEKIGTVIS